VNSILKHVLAAILGALMLMLGVAPSKALEELKVYRGVLVLEGKIVPGDFVKVRNFIRTKSNFDKISDGVFLASPGGSVDEALEIGHLIRALQLSTDAPSGPPIGIAKFGESLIRASDLVDPKANYLCASACFLIYVAGIYRYPIWAGRLGIHRPVRSASSLKPLSGDDTMKSIGGARELIKNYLKEMNVPEKYVDLMFSIPPNGLRWITQAEFDSDLQGFIPEFRTAIDANCEPRTNRVIHEDSRTPQDTRTSENAMHFSVSAKQSTEIIKCRKQFQAELPINAWYKVFSGN
jgi:hypothetical protein